LLSFFLQQFGVLATPLLRLGLENFTARDA
jgi:hypothetical protein